MDNVVINQKRYLPEEDFAMLLGAAVDLREHQKAYMAIRENGSETTKEVMGYNVKEAADSLDVVIGNLKEKYNL